MTVKLVLLIVGGLLVALASRWAVTPASGFWGWSVITILFLLGQALARFEDYPAGSRWVSRLEKRR